MPRYSIEVEFQGFTSIIVDAISAGEAIEKAEDYFEEEYYPGPLRNLSATSASYEITDSWIPEGEEGSDKDAEIELLKARIAKLEGES